MTTATMTRSEVMQRIEATGVVAVVRLTDPGVGEQVARALMSGGVDAIEITMTVPRAEELIATLVKALPEALIGAGTVTDADTARAVIDAGAKFVVSPNAPVKQVWVSAHMRSFKLDWDPAKGEFVLPDSGQSLSQLIEEAVSQQLGSEVKL